MKKNSYLFALKNMIVNPCDAVKRMNKTDFKNICDYLENLVVSWKDENYSGLTLELDLTNVDRDYDGLIDFKTIVDSVQSKFVRNIKKKIDEFPPTQKGLNDFLNALNFKGEKRLNLWNPTSYRIEGSTCDEHYQIYDQIVENPDSANFVMEIGFNAGNSALYFLNKCPNAKMISVDLGLHSYVFYSKLFIDTKFPGRHLLLTGDSYQQVKTLCDFTNQKFDYIFIDGHHSYVSAHYDITNCRNLSSKDTKIILDNVAPHRGSGNGPYVALLNLYRDKFLHKINHYEVCDYHDGFATFNYVFDDDFEPCQIDYKHIERHMVNWILDGLVNYIEKMSRKMNVSESIKDLRNLMKKFKQHDITIEDQLIERIQKFIF